jgi:hypothetical protein
LTKDIAFYRDQEERCRRLAKACPTASISEALLRLADEYAAEIREIEASSPPKDETD